MSTVIVDVSDLRSFDGDCVTLLVDFLRKKLSTNVASAKNEVTLEFEQGNVASRSCLRLILRKFLYKESLKEDLRVISGGENSFIIKLRKSYSE
jgi:hypothetical protein